jgi:molybdopterin-containing oxidoreductase family iron-sulfur binding subunit
LPLGFGRRVTGKIGSGTGFDVYPLRALPDHWRLAGARVAKLDGFYQLVTSQHGDRMAGRDLVKTGTLDRFLHDRDFLKKAEERSPDRADKSLYPAIEYKDDAWAMAINLNSCIGCQACVVACEAENNTPIVGKEEAFRGRLMQWLRVDRYYSGGPDGPDTYFQPVPCMHCENAPCEVVCPVQATVHDHDGLNVMVYNRCVGTRFCSNNCPYKVRRFNFFAYAHLDPRLDEAWNPDVSVRDRGVMEKCTYCVQRIRETKIRADRENRPVRDGEVVTACQAACPTEAIVFGDKNDRDSAVAARKASPLDYALLEELNTRPRTTYEARLRNPNPAIEES